MIPHPLTAAQLAEMIKRHAPRLVVGKLNEPLPNGGGWGHKALGPEIKKPWCRRGWSK